MFERFSKEARETVVRAQQVSRDLRHSWVGTEHLLLALLAEPQSPGSATLVRQGVTAEACRAAVTALVAGDGDGFEDGDAEALRAFGIDLDEVRRRTDRHFGPGALDAPRDPGEGTRPWLFVLRRPGTDRIGGHVPFTRRAKKALELSLREAIAHNDRRIGTEHLLLALLRSDDRITTGLFRRLDIDPDETRTAVLTDLRNAA